MKSHEKNCRARETETKKQIKTEEKCMNDDVMKGKKMRKSRHLGNL